MLTDWLMVGITGVYVVATILICIFNARSAKATRQQVAESIRQYEESKRLETMPFLQLELPTEEKQPIFEIELESCGGDVAEVLYKIVRLKNLGNGSASNITYAWKRNNAADSIYGYLPNAIMHGDSYFLQLTYAIDEDSLGGVLIWHYDDLLGNSYEQRVYLNFCEGKLTQCENDIPRFIGTIVYKLSEDSANSKTIDGDDKNA